MSLRIRLLTAAAVLSLMLPGCALKARPGTPIYDDSRSAVHLVQVPDRSFQASHPISIEPTTISRALNGLIVTDEKTAVQALLGSEMKSSRVFSQEEAEFLAPWISKALSRAGPDQEVGFRITRGVGRTVPPTMTGAAVGSSLPAAVDQQVETTSGTLFVHGLSLHMTVTAYRARPSTPGTISGPNRYYPDTTGLDRRDVAFVPESARRPDTYRQDFLGRSQSSSVVVDYEWLAKFGSAVAASASTGASVNEGTQSNEPSAPFASFQRTSRQQEPSASEEDIRSLKDLVIQKDMELEALKKQVRSLKRQLDERDAQLDVRKKKGKPAPKIQETPNERSDQPIHGINPR